MKGDEDSIFCLYQPLIFATGNNTPPCQKRVGGRKELGEGKNLEKYSDAPFLITQECALHF